MELADAVGASSNCSDPDNAMGESRKETLRVSFAEALENCIQRRIRYVRKALRQIRFRSTRRCEI